MGSGYIIYYSKLFHMCLLCARPAQDLCMPRGVRWTPLSRSQVVYNRDGYICNEWKKVLQVPDIPVKDFMLDRSQPRGESHGPPFCTGPWGGGGPESLGWGWDSVTFRPRVLKPVWEWTSPGTRTCLLIFRGLVWGYCANAVTLSL